MRALCIGPSAPGIRSSSFSSSGRTTPHSSRAYFHAHHHHHRRYSLHQGAFRVEHPRRSRLQVKCSNSAPMSSGNKNTRGIKERSPNSTGRKAAESRQSYPAIPGPTANSLESLIDVSSVIIDGIHEATLKYAVGWRIKDSGDTWRSWTKKKSSRPDFLIFSPVSREQIKYGDICRFENPINLNEVSGWTFVNSPELVQHVANSPNYSERYLPDVYKFVTNGKGILGSEGRYNRKHRALCSPPFRREKYLERFAENIKDCTRRAVEPIVQEIQTHKSRNTLGGGSGIKMDVADLSQHLTLDIILDVAFSSKVQTAKKVNDDAGTLDAEGIDKLITAINRAQLLMGKVFVTPISVLKAMRKMQEPAITEIDKEFKKMRTIMEPIIESRRKRLAEFKQSPLYGLSADDKYAEIEKFGIESDLLTTLLIAENEEGSPLSNDEIWEDVHDVTGAGHETTASTIAATIFYISAHQDIERQVLDEIRALKQEGVEIGFDSVRKLAKLEACVKEVLRLHPPIPLFPRKADKSEILPTGHRIPAKDVVFMSSYSMGRNPRIWGDDAEEFKPLERFLQPSKNTQSEKGGEARGSKGGCPFSSSVKESSEASDADNLAKHKYSWVPFGAGPRMCLGAPFAMLSVTVAVATLLEKLRFRPVDESSKSLDFEYDITVFFPKGIPMQIESRE